MEDIEYNKVSILVVDDEEVVRKPIVDMLKYLGFSAQGVDSGEKALEVLQKETYDFMLTDMRMPGMDGLELIRKIMNDYPNVCIIAMTGYSSEYKYVEVVNAGATDFINKPFGVEELEAKVRRAIIERNARLELSRLSITDSLTNLYNQRHFYTRLEDETRRAERQKNGLALILFDLDSFKLYNDNYGHLAGDRLLSKVGDIINAKIRQGVDSGYRYGGDEFAVILIDAQESIVKAIGKRIEAGVEQECGLGVSMGYSIYTDNMSAEEIVAEADKNLYKVKARKHS